MLRLLTTVVVMAFIANDLKNPENTNKIFNAIISGKKDITEEKSLSETTKLIAEYEDVFQMFSHFKRF